MESLVNVQYIIQQLNDPNNKRCDSCNYCAGYESNVCGKGHESHPHMIKNCLDYSKRGKL